MEALKGSRLVTRDIPNIITLIVLISIAISPRADSQTQNAGTASPNPIEHIIILVKENRTYDNYFGKYPKGNGATSGMLSNGTTIPLMHADNNVVSGSVNNGRGSAYEAYNNRQMNGFDKHSGQTPDGHYVAYSQYEEADMPNYWAYARQFTLCDSFFSSMMGPVFQITYICVQRRQAVPSGILVVGSSVQVLGDVQLFRAPSSPSWIVVATRRTCPLALTSRHWLIYSQQKA